MKRMFAALMALCMLVSVFSVTAMAAENGPTIERLGVAGVLADANDGGSLAAIVPSNTVLAGQSFSMVTSDAVTFVEDSNPQLGALYVADATDTSVILAFNLGSDPSAYSISMTTSDGVNWSGSFASDFGMTMGEFAQALSAAGATLKEGAMVGTGGSENSAYSFFCNQDAANVQLVVCPENALTYDVTYMVKYDESDPMEAYTWEVPAGTALYEPALGLTSSQTLQGWYTDADMSQSADFSATVNEDTTLYGKVTTTVSGSFAQAFAAQEEILTISDSTDWDSFITLANQISSNQRVVLACDIDCNDATYTTLTFAGDFDGGNHTISNATFTASSGNSGMFHTIGAGQKICNLTLSNITAQYAGTYAGVLAGAVSGTEGNRALIQNVHVVNGSVSGRSAGGLAGFIFWTDVKYCSSTGTTISGTVNGGGLGGISYGSISQSCSDTAPTALPLLGTTGGIVAKNLETGSITSCWCTDSRISGSSTDATESKVLANATGTSVFDGVELESGKWFRFGSTLPALIKPNCTYTFPADGNA